MTNARDAVRGVGLFALWAVLVVCCAAGTARAEIEQPGTGSVEFASELINAPVVVRLTNGNVLTGTLAEVDGADVVLEHELLGEIVIPRIAVAGISRETLQTQPEDDIEQEVPGSVPEPSDVLPLEPQPPAQPPAAAPDEPVVERPKAQWTNRFRLGLNGTQGPTDQFDIRTSLSSDRTTPNELLSLRISYQLSERDGRTTRDRFVSRVRQEWGRGNTTPWSIFAEGEAEIDQTREEDARLRGTAGLSYQFFKDEKGEMLGRVGLGGSYDVGGIDESVDPEALLAISFSRKITERQTIRLSGEFFPLLNDAGEYRANARGAWEVALTEDGSVTLRLGGENRYDSTQPSDQNVVDYFAEVQWAF